MTADTDLPTRKDLQNDIQRGFSTEGEQIRALMKDVDDLRTRQGNFETMFRAHLERAGQDHKEQRAELIALAAETKDALEKINERITTMVSFRNLFFSTLVVCSVSSMAALMVGIYQFYHG